MTGYGFGMLVTEFVKGSESARGCCRCGEAITLDDGFGLSEGICRSCVWRSQANPPAETTGISRVVQRLRRAA